MHTLQLLLWCGVVAGPLFIFIFLVEGFLRPNYDWMRQPVSALSQGPRGWIQQANFFICGALLVACAWGLHLALAHSLWEPLLIFFYGAGLLGAGVFVTDFGMQRSTTRSGHSVSGAFHDLFSTVVFVSLTIACFVFAHFFFTLGLVGWALYSAMTGTLYLVGFVVFAGALNPKSRLAPIGGLLQRLTISLGAIWVTLIALHFLR